MEVWLGNNWQWVLAAIAVPLGLAFLNHALAARRDIKKPRSSATQKPSQTINSGHFSKNYNAGRDIRITDES